MNPDSNLHTPRPPFTPEVNRKQEPSMLTTVILSLASAHQPMSIADIAAGIASTTGWQVTERGLYRTLKRLQAEGLLHGTDVDAPRTGAKRRELSLTDLGAEFLAGVTEHLIDPSSID